jgi:hypothetical protein
MKAILAATLALGLAACATANTGTPAAGGATTSTTTTTATGATTSSAASLNPVGTYEFATEVNGDAVTGTMEITGTPGAYAGRVVTLRFPEFTVRSASAEGQVLTVVAATPTGDVTFRMAFTGQTFAGTWSLGGDTGPVTGRRTR